MRNIFKIKKKCFEKIYKKTKHDFQIENDKNLLHKKHKIQISNLII